VEGVLVVLRRAVEVLVDPDQAGVLGVTARDRVVLQRPELLGQGDVLGAGDVLVADEEDLVLQEQRPQLREEVVVAGGLGEADVAQLGADERGERGDLDAEAARIRKSLRRSGGRDLVECGRNGALCAD